MAMVPISKRQEAELDSEQVGYAVVETKGAKIKVDRRSAILYGEINVDKREDIDLIESKTIINSLFQDKTSYMHSTFNYAKGEFHTEENGVPKMKSARSNMEWFLYNHCLIGKPERVLCFNVSLRDLV